jgi:hypothetical protein
MVKAKKYHYAVGEVKSKALEFILMKNEPVAEPDIRGYLQTEYDGITQATVNRHLNDLGDTGCIKLISPSKKTTRANRWSIAKLSNLEKIIEEYPDLTEILQKSELALKIVLDALEDALVSSTNLKKTKEYKEEYDVIKARLLMIRTDLTIKLKMSSSFFKLCVQDDYSLWRNLSDLLDISENPTAEAYIGDNFKLFITSPSCIDLVFKSCIVMEIMQRKVNYKEDLKNEIEYIKKMNNIVDEKQLKKVKKYYEKLITERNTIKQLEETDPDKQIEYLKNNYEKFFKAPGFIKWQKFVEVHNIELQELENYFEDNDGEWDYLKNDEQEGSA